MIVWAANNWKLCIAKLRAANAPIGKKERFGNGIG